MMRSANPTLSDSTFKNIPRVSTGGTMTLSGTVNKSFILTAVLLVAATYTWSKCLENPALYPLYTGVGFIGGFIFALITMFKKNMAPITAPIYAVLEGVGLGALSVMFEQKYPGIAFQAFVATMGTLFALLMAYRSGMIKATENFKLGVAAATGGIFFLYLISMILGFFGVQMSFLHDSSPLSIGLSCVIIIVAALNLVMDFDFIEHGAERGLPKYMEWYGAFGLLVTLIWLYIEFLRLFAKLQGRK